MHDNDQGVCESGYLVDGSLIIPCLWTECGCIANGDNLLECPNLVADCAALTPAPTSDPASRCDEFCQYENLSERFGNWTRSAANPSFCFYYKHRSDLCQTSYLQDSGLKVPCTWSGSDCVADRTAALDCSAFACASLLEAHASSKRRVEPVAATMLLEMRSLRSKTDIHSEDEAARMQQQKRVEKQ